MSALRAEEWFAAACELEGENVKLRRIAHELFFACARLQERAELACYGRELIEQRFPEPEEPAL